MNFLASPTIVTAMAFSGKLSFNPMVDSITTPTGETFRFSPPQGQDLPAAGFTVGKMQYYPKPTPEPQPNTDVVIRPDSQRLETLAPFPSHFKEGSGNERGMELPPLKVLMRVRGKCTTDHISAAVSASVKYGSAERRSNGFPTGTLAQIQRASNEHIREPPYVLFCMYRSLADF